MRAPPAYRTRCAVGLVAALAAGSAAAAAPTQGGGVRHYKSGPIQTTADGSAVWVANAESDSVSRIDTSNGGASHFSLPNRQTRNLPLGIAVTDDGDRVWVAAHDADRVIVLDGAGTLVHEIPMPWGSGPLSVALAPPGTDAGTPGRPARQPWALVTLHRGAALAAISTTDYSVTILEPVYKSPMGIAFTEDGESAWVTHLFVDGEHPHLTRVDFAHDPPRVSTHFNAFAATPRHSGSLTSDQTERNVAEGGYLNFRGHPAPLPSYVGARQLWIPTQYHNMTEDNPSADSTIQATLRKLDLDTRTVLPADKVILTAKHVHDPTRGDQNPPWLGYGWDASVSGLVDVGFVDLSGSDPAAVVVAEQSNEIVVVPWNTPPLKSAESAHAPGLAELRVGARPMGIAVSPVAPVAYVYNRLSFDVSVVDLSAPAAPRISGTIPLAPPDPGSDAADPNLLRGMRLFFSSADPRISENEKVACASCHINAEHDGRTWSFQHLPSGSHGQAHGPRSNPSLLGVGLTFAAGERDGRLGFGQLHHSGDRDEVQDFDHTFAGPQMGGTGFLGSDRQPELGPPNAGRDADLDAVATFIETLPPLSRSPSRNTDGSLTRAAERGATFFVGSDGGRPADAACAACHVPEAAFTDRGFHDVGQRRPGEEQELSDPTTRGACLWCVNTPSLVGAWASHPFDGLYRWSNSMTGAIEDFRDRARPAAHGHPQGLTRRQVADLAEFVESIDGDMLATDVRGLRDTTPPRIARVAPTSLRRIEVWFDETIDRASSTRPDAWRLTDTSTGQVVEISAVEYDAQNGDRVTVLAALRAASLGVKYRLEAVGPILDAAATASHGVANRIDSTNPANTREFTLAERLTITLGASGYENLTIRVHDMSPVGPGLSTWAHDRVQVASRPSDGALTPGFVRFDWQEAFQTATGVSDPTDVLAATFSMQAGLGDAQTLELRRTLQHWEDSEAAGDWNQNPVGGPTWRDHAHPDARWNRAGAATLGGSGADPADYNAVYDLAETVDAVVAMPAINTRISFGSDLITEAYRFWMTHPDLDYGHAVRLRHEPPEQPFASFLSHEEDLQWFGPVLEITYRLSSDESPGPNLFHLFLPAVHTPR